MPNNLPANYQPIVFNEQVFSCRLASDVNLTGNLAISNDVNGLGTTLTNVGTLATLVIDSVTVSIGDRILLFSQTSSEQNGVYVVADTGSINTPWILTRAPDWCCSEQLQTGQYISIEDGTALKGNIYVFVRPFPNRINFDPIIWVAVAASSGGGVNPGLADQIAYYPINGSVLSGTSTLPSLVQVNPINLNGGVGATSSTFYRGDGSWATISSSIAGSDFEVYVSPNGDNLNGNGSFAEPFLTIEYALSQITTASSVNRYVIKCLYGSYQENPFALKPWVNIDGQGSNLKVLGNINADASFSAGGQTIFTNFNNLDLTNLSLDVSSSAGNFCEIILENLIFSAISQLNLKGGNLTRIYLFNLAYPASDINTVLENVFGKISECSFGSFDFTASLVGTTLDLNLYNSSASITNLVSNLGALGFTCIISNTKIFGTFTVSGATATTFVDCASLDSASLPVIVGGANVFYLNVSNTLLANYSPANYIPTDLSVNGHLVGIDNKLSAFNSVINSWTEVTGTSQAASVRSGYITNNVGLVSVTLPSSCIVGDIVAIQGKGAGGWSLIANAGQTIHVGNTATSVGGSVSSSNQWDAIEVICITANTTWAMRPPVGSFTIV